MQFASNLGTIQVKENSNANLLNDFQPWLRAFRRVCSGKNISPNFLSLLREIDSNSYHFCAEADSDKRGSQLTALLVSLGDAQRQIAVRPKFQDIKSKQYIPPIKLSQTWLYECHIDSDLKSSFDLARCVASICGEKKKDSIRENVEPVDVSEKGVAWAIKSVRAVWGNGSLEDNLAAVVHRRSIDARMNNLSHPVLRSSYFASLQAVTSFLNDESNDERMEELLLGFALIDWVDYPSSYKKSSKPTIPPMLPRAYALLKLLFLPNGEFRRDHKSETIIVKHEPAIVPLLRAGRVSEALKLACQRLQVSGLTPVPASFYSGLDNGTRLAAALLIPIDEPSIQALASLVLRDKKENQ